MSLQHSTIPSSEQVKVRRAESTLPSEAVLRSWNTRHLGLRVGTDAVSAAAASALVAPIICVIDRSIVRKAATGAPLSGLLISAAKNAVIRPHRFLTSRPFLLVFSLYWSTYFTANTVDTITSTVQGKNAATVTSGATKFAATSAVNMTMCVYKDSQFAKLFGNSSSVAAKIPRLSYALFACRDSLTIFASFNLPAMIAPKLAELPDSVKSRFSRILNTESGRMNTAQFITPAAMQVVSTPLHLLSLDLYNRQGKLGVSERGIMVVKNWAVCAFARMGRILPAFSCAAVVNSQSRARIMKELQ